MVDFSSFLAGNDEGVIFTCGLLLSPEQQQSAIELFKKVQNNNTGSLKYSLNNHTHPPYLRLYETIIPLKNVEKATLFLKEISQSANDLPILWGQLEMTEHFVAVWGELNPLLQDFHTKLLQNLNPLREGYFKEKYIEESEEHTLTEEEILSFQKWGSPWAEPYVPHVIIAKATPRFEHLCTDLDWEYHHGRLKGLIWGTRNQEGDFSQINRVYFSSEEVS